MKPKSKLGVDLGSSMIKLVELSSDRENPKLLTYGLAYFNVENSLAAKISSFSNAGSSGQNENSASDFTSISETVFGNLSSQEIGQILKELMKKSQTRSKAAHFSIPAFATFSTIVDLPVMSPEEIAAAVPFEARKYIPVPLEEVVLDWAVVPLGGKTPPLPNPRQAPEEIEESMLNQKPEQDTIAALNQQEESKNSNQQPERIQVFLVAILKSIIEKYSKIAKIAGVDIRALESESFGLARSLVGENTDLTIIINIGSFYTDVTLIDSGFIKIIHNAVSVVDSQTKNIIKESLIAEIERVLNLYKSKYDHAQKVRFILTGGKVIAHNPEYLKHRFANAEVSIGNPFQKLEYPQILNPILGELGPSLAVATGVALRQ
jgi:type IV pilus assembly protein PilM